MDELNHEHDDLRIQALVDAYEEAGDAAFFDSEAFQDIIDYYEDEEDIAKALKVARLAASKYPFSSTFYVREAQLLLYSNQMDAALEVMDYALSLSPGDMELSLLRAEVCIRMGRTDEGLAILAYFKAEADAEDMSDILVIESLVPEMEQDYEAVFQLLKQAVLLHPSSEMALERANLCARICRNYEEGCELFQTVIDNDPYFFLAWYYLGQLRYLQGETEASLEALEYAFITNPDFEDAYHDYVEICMEAGMFRQALKVNQEITERFVTDSEVLLNTGTCYQHLEQYETARTYLEQAARLEPHNDEVIFKIGECYAAQEKWGKAVAYFQKAVRMQPEYEQYHRALAEAAFELADYELAEKGYKTALDLLPDNNQHWLDLAWFYLEMLRPAEAMELLSEANDTFVDAEVRYSYIACLFANHRKQEALSALSEALLDDYESSRCLFDWQPILRVDKDVQVLMGLYRPQAEGLA